MNDSINNPAAPILVTGGTGTLGRHVVARLRRARHPVRVLARHPGESQDGVEQVVGDLSTNEGIEPAIAGVEIVIHCAGTAKGDDVKARHLVDAASATGVRHVVFISVVGADLIPMDGSIDRTMFGYFGAKRAAEQIVAESGIPWTTLRATQFYDATLAAVRQLARTPIIPVPGGFRFQPVDVDEVAGRLVELALAKPAGLVAPIAGPTAYDLAELVRTYLRASGRHRLIVSMPLPGAAARAIRSGVNLAPDHAVGQRTWEQFLAANTGSTSVATEPSLRR